ncbi:polysaccharide deacetylase family protein [Microvirga antarctica]|uniref:polysaccharide deacetylase family protein n=1 Tax=Microvirga antarctica TaxID=2819233 RepID=UPI001B306F3C|nr:polysaccharide deacetylase family protein [Microvirga antarctica]
MPTARRPGMDHAIYPYSAVPDRAPFRLASGKPIALYIVLQIEHYELFTPDGAYREPRFKGEFGTFTPDYRTWSYRQYGNRVGLYRVLEVLDDLAVPVTAAIGAGAIEAHPEIVGAIASRGYEIAAHGLTANRMITSHMSAEVERDHILQSRDALQSAFGVQPRGWLSQDFGNTPRTSALLREAGFSYTMDWANDEQPYLQLDAPGLIALPAPSEWDDVQTLALRRVSAERFPGLVADAIEGLAGAPADSARALAIGVHPWVFGTAHRIRYLREVLEHAQSHPAVDIMTAGTLADTFARQARQI